jgi:hypothetical protein
LFGINEPSVGRMEVFSMIRNLKEKVYDTKIFITEHTKQMKKIEELLQVEVPVS